MLTQAQLMEKIRDVPDFPQAGIMFKDITPLLADAQAFYSAVDYMAEQYRGQDISTVVAIEARGYLFGAPLAHHLECGFVPIRKVGKLPWRTIKEEYALEYGSATIEMHLDSLVAGQRVVIVDDVLATGGTLAAAAKLVEQSGAKVVGMAVLLELGFLNGREKLKGYDIFSLLST